jgi:glycosyltransferase involved in cell wall biosynthesis
LLLIGDGPERQHMETICREEGTCDEVFFLGKMTEPESILANCDLFVLTSETESFGLASLEAMACGVPVVSTNTGGTPEVVEEGVSGLLSPVGDVAQMTANALRILGDPAVHVRYAEGALQIAAKFDLIRILPLYENLYTEVVERMKANGVHQRSR